MEMKNFDKQILAKNGFKFETERDLLLYVANMVSYLESHNKQYTKEQWYKISALDSIFESVL